MDSSVIITVLKILVCAVCVSSLAFGVWCLATIFPKPRLSLPEPRRGRAEHSVASLRFPEHLHRVEQHGGAPGERLRLLSAVSDSEAYHVRGAAIVTPQIIRCRSDAVADVI